MNIQIRRFGKNVVGLRPEIPNRTFCGIDELFTDGLQLSPCQQGAPLRVCIYFDIGDEVPVSYIKSERDLSDWVIIYRNQHYQCNKSRQTGSDLYKTIIVPLDERDIDVDISAATF